LIMIGSLVTSSLSPSNTFADYILTISFPT